MLSSFLTSWFSGAPPSGEREAQEAQYQEVMRTLGPALLRVGSAYGFKGADREEIEQDIAVAIWEALPGWNSDSSLKTYLFRVAHNTSIDRLRRAGRQGRQAETEEIDNQSAVGSSPESKAMERQALEHLQRTIEAPPAATTGRHLIDGRCVDRRDFADLGDHKQLRPRVGPQSSANTQINYGG